MTRLPIDYRNTLDTIASLPGSWYAAQEIPPRLIRNLGKAPLVNEWEIDRERFLVSRPVAEVLAHAANGMTADESAAVLFKSPHTVRGQRRDALSTLRARNMTQAVAAAIRLGVLVPADEQKAA